MSTSPGLRPCAPASMYVCAFVAALIVTAPGLFSAGAEGTMSAAATIAAVPPTSFQVFLLIETVSPSSTNRRIVPAREERVGRARPARLETACLRVLRGG